MQQNVVPILMKSAHQRVRQ